MFSQKTQEVPILGLIKDGSKKVQNITVLDQRENKTLGTTDFKNKSVEFIFEKNNAEAFFKEWFTKFNKEPKGNNSLVIVLDKVFFKNDISADGKNHLTVDIKASTFLVKNEQYFFLKRVNSSMKTLQGFPDNPEGIAVTASLAFQYLLKESYTQTPSSFAVSKDQLANYENVLISNLAAYKNQEVSNGIYTSYESFFSQTPLVGYELTRNSNNDVTKAKKGEVNLSSNKIFAYVENNKAYINTAGGFLELLKDDTGFYVVSNEGTLNPAQMNSTYGMFGLLGAGIGAIQTSAKNKSARKAPTSKIYIDPLNGKYIYGN
jgi:hypothetical protein